MGIQGATSDVGRGGRAAGGHRMIPKDCKRLAEVDFPMPRSASTRRGRSAVEVWGRGTNRVIDMCEKHGAPPPVFEEKQGFLVVTFRAPGTSKGRAVPGSGQPESRPESQPESSTSPVPVAGRSNSGLAEGRRVACLHPLQTAWTEKSLRPAQARTEQTSVRLHNRVYHPRQTQQSPAKIPADPGG